MQKSVVLIRRNSERTADSNVNLKVNELLERATKGVKNWSFNFGKTVEVEFEEKIGLYTFKKKVTFTRNSGHKSTAEKQWTVLLTRLIKTGMRTGYGKYPWTIESDGAEEIRKQLESQNVIPVRANKSSIKDIGKVSIDPKDYYDHIYGRDDQIKILTSAIVAGKESDWLNRFHCVLFGPPGCHRKGQKIIMANGEVKAVEKINIDDKLLGPSGEIKTVKLLVRGTGQMYKIVPTKGNEFVVNEDHILTLSRSKGKTKGTLLDISVKEYLNWSANRKSNYKLIRSDNLEFHRNDPIIDIDPYFVGLMLGDGTFSQGIRITSHVDDVLVHDYLEKISKENGIGLSKYKNSKKPNVFDFRFTKSKLLHKMFLMHGLVKTRSGTKFIPTCYKFGSNFARKQILAGLIDTDGEQHGNIMCITTKSVHLANDILFVARSLGLAAYLGKPKVVNGKIYQRVNLSGHLDIIPCKLNRKKCSLRKQIKNVLRTGFKVEKLGIEKYYGFNIDGDQRYLLDDFTITHNCGKSDILISTGKMLGMENEAFMKLDATSTTEAGAQRLLLDAEHIPPVLIVEEIEKTDEKSLRWLLGILDHRAEIRKTNFNIGNRAKNVKMLCLATVNDLGLFKKAMSGALASRFAHEIYCPRPDRVILEKILEREVIKSNGKREWIEPTLQYCYDNKKLNDPRKIIPVCLCGRDSLLDGSYQQSLTNIEISAEDAKAIT